MKWGLRSNSFRYALALWLATVLALLTAFVVQLEPAQWAAITVWIVFIQNPRMNYSKVIWWAFGTITGALMAAFLTVCFAQAPELLLLFLALWLSVCAGAARLVTYYRAYGAVLAGYTCAIVAMSAVDHPDQIFLLAITRMSCIFIGMTSAIFMIGLLLPKHEHWRETLHHFNDHLRTSLQQAAQAISLPPPPTNRSSWRRLTDRLTILEHTLDVTTAETADSRIHTPQARSLVAALFDLLAKAQAIQMHLSRSSHAIPSPEVTALLRRIEETMKEFATSISVKQAQQPPAILKQIEDLNDDVKRARQNVIRRVPDDALSDHFVLDRLAEVLQAFALAVQDWRGLYGPWSAQRVSHLTVHRDYQSAIIYGLRMFLAMAMVSGLWFITRWPSGSQLILFTAVVCSLLSLQDNAPSMGLPFLKSTVFCALMAYIEAFWLFPKGENFLALALMLGLFLLPAAYAYRHPRLIGSAVVSMLIFYGLSMPANMMNYDISAFLNNGLALLCAAAGGFFAFHAVPSLGARARRFWLLHSVRQDLANISHGFLSEQSWITRHFDRLSLLHRAAGTSAEVSAWLAAENEMMLSLQLGLRLRRLFSLRKTKPMAADAITEVLHACRHVSRHPQSATLDTPFIQEYLKEKLPAAPETEYHFAVKSEVAETTRLLETYAHFRTQKLETIHG